MSERESSEPTTELYGLSWGETPWGDYGHILYHGMSHWRDSRRKALPLERTGPFVPPIFFPSYGNVVLTDAFKRKVQAQEFVGATFKRVQKKKIVKLNWHEWDLTAREPDRFPPENEPENYIDRRKHNEEISRQIGELWELAPVTVKGMILDRDGGGITNLGQYAGQDVCLPSFPALRYRDCAIVSPRFKVWIDKNAGEWVSLRQIYPPCLPGRRGILARLLRR